MRTVKHAFKMTIVAIPVAKIVPTVPVKPQTLQTSKFLTILSSVRELGVIEPLAVFPDPRGGSKYNLLDGHLRLEALKQLKEPMAPCMISLDDEGFTFNRHYNRIAPVQEHRMIMAALAKGASEKRIAEVLRVDIRKIKEKIHLLDNIAPEAVTLLKDRHLISKVFTLLRKMKPFRQIEAAEMMIAANRYTATYVSMILMTTRPEGLVSVDSKKKQGDDVSLEDINRMEMEMERLHQDYQAVEDTLGDTMLSLVVAKGFVNRLLRNENIFDHMKRNHADLLETLNTTMEAIAADSRTPQRE